VDENHPGHIGKMTIQVETVKRIAVLDISNRFDCHELRLRAEPSIMLSRAKHYDSGTSSDWKPKVLEPVRALARKCGLIGWLH